MLVLSRKCGESVIIGDNVEVTILEIRGNRIRLGITAPDEIKVLRSGVERHTEDNDHGED